MISSTVYIHTLSRKERRSQRRASTLARLHQKPEAVSYGLFFLQIIVIYRLFLLFPLYKFVSTDSLGFQFQKNTAPIWAMATVASKAADSYIGSLICLITKSDIRYEGFLFHLDALESTIGLRNGIHFC